MFLSQRSPDGKPQRACTLASHSVISRCEALFKTLTTPAGYQDLRDLDGSVLELGVCKNCGSTLSRKLTHEQLLAYCLVTGGAA